MANKFYDIGPCRRSKHLLDTRNAGLKQAFQRLLRVVGRALALLLPVIVLVVDEPQHHVVLDEDEDS